MAENEKLTILHLMDLLLDRTDKDHTMTADMICSALETDYEIVCSRKTVCRDITRLREYGLKIEQLRGSTPGYYVDDRDFELAELKLLVDAVQSSKFITEEKSRDLIRKLGRLTSRENSKLKKELRQKHEGQLYHVSPWSLTWDDENYYLVGFDEATKTIKHYRVDKMQDISLTHSYPGDITMYPQETPVGATCTGQVCIGVDHPGSFKIYVDTYDGNEEKQSAVFALNVE